MNKKEQVMNIIESSYEIGNLIEWQFHAIDHNTSLGLDIPPDFYHTIADCSERLVNLTVLLDSHKNMDDELIKSAIYDIKQTFFKVATNLVVKRMKKINKDIDQIIENPKKYPLGCYFRMKDKIATISPMFSVDDIKWQNDDINMYHNLKQKLQTLFELEGIYGIPIIK